MPAIGRDEFKRRRRALLKQMGRDSIAIVPTAPVRLRNNDVEYAYRPDSDFFYLTGFNEPESVAVLVPGRPQGEYILFVRDRDPARETWDGRRAGPEGATRDYGADDAFPIGDIDEILPGLIENRAQGVLRHGHAPRVRPAGRRLGERPAHPGAQRPPSAAGDRRARSRAARHAPLQEPRRGRHHARGGADRGAGARARHEGLRARQARIRNRRRGRARIPRAQRRPVLSADRRRRRERLHPALPRKRRDAARRRPAADRRGLRGRLLRVRHHAHVPGQRPVLGRAARVVRHRARGELRRHRRA